VVVTNYDPATGAFATPDGQILRQANLASPGGAKTWQELLPTG
jgi:phospholipid/cholesterol/gamma-HCH transport system substrate-binding protein